MKEIALVALCYLLCHFIKPIWKAAIVGIVSYVLISFIIMTTTVPTGTKLNITGNSVSYFVADRLGEFIAYFLFGLIIFLIFNRTKKTNSEIQENSATDESNDNSSN